MCSNAFAAMFLLASLAGNASAHPVVTACEDDEVVVFSCDLPDHSHVAVCVTEADDTQALSLVYRASGKTIVGGITTHATADGAFFLGDLGYTKGRQEQLRFIDRGREVVVYSASDAYEGNAAGVAVFEAGRRVANARCTLPGDLEPWPMHVPPSLATPEAPDWDRPLATPGFSDYPAGPAYTGPAAPLDLSEPASRMFRTRLREALAEPSAFAGEYAMALWACGSDCLTGAAVNRRTGRVVFLPGTLCCSSSDDGPLRYRVDSRLLVIDAVISDGRPGWGGEPGSHLFLLEDDGFRYLESFAAGTPLPDEPAPAAE
jgi:hypothetical protein